MLKGIEGDESGLDEAPPPAARPLYSLLHFTSFYVDSDLLASIAFKSGKKLLDSVWGRIAL